MKIMNKCPKCGSNNISRGKLLTIDPRVRPGLGVAYIPENKKWKPFKPGIMPISFVCRDCGFLETFINVDELRELEK